MNASVIRAGLVLLFALGTAVTGRATGRRIARHVLDNALQPVAR